MSPLAFDLFNPTDEHRQLRETVRSLVKKELDPKAASYDEREAFDLELFKRLGTEMGLFGLTVSSELGGAGLDPVASVIVIEELSRADPGFGLSYLAHEVLFVHNFFNSGNAEQHKRYLPKVIGGEWIAGMAMTEPEVGTDVLGMRTVAVKKGDRYILNGTKQFITNGPYGSLFLVYAKLDDAKRRDISAFLVESKFKGFSVGKKESKMGMRSSPTSCLVFEDCEVPAENLIGQEGHATVHMMRNLEIERITLSAQSTGICLRCVEEMNRYAVALRKSFGKALIEHGQMQRLCAESYAETEAARAFVYYVAHQLDPKERHSLAAASAKLVAPAIGERVARNAIQVMGGYGYCRDYPVERLLRDAILLSIGGGTNEAMQKNIARDLQKEYA